MKQLVAPSDSIDNCTEFTLTERTWFILFAGQAFAQLGLRYDGPVTQAVYDLTLIFIEREKEKLGLTRKPSHESLKILLRSLVTNHTFRRCDES